MNILAMNTELHDHNDHQENVAEESGSKDNNSSWVTDYLLFFTQKSNFHHFHVLRIKLLNQRRNFVYTLKLIQAMRASDDGKPSRQYDVNDIY